MNLDKILAIKYPFTLVSLEMEGLNGPRERSLISERDRERLKSSSPCQTPELPSQCGRVTYYLGSGIFIHENRESTLQAPTDGEWSLCVVFPLQSISITISMML